MTLELTGALNVLAGTTGYADVGAANAANTRLNAIEASVTALGGGGAASLVPTAVKTAAYNAVVGDFIPVDTTSGAVTITLPTAPADKAQIGIKHVTQGGTNAVTLTAGGSDVFNKTGGVTTGTLALLNEGVVLQYKASGAIWYVLNGDKALSALDARYGLTATGILKSSGTAITALTNAQAMAQLSATAGASFSLNSQKITALANGSAASDAAAFGQIPLLDATATDITIPGTQAAGATGKAADAGHVHSRETTSGYVPGDYTWRAWAFDPISGAGSLVLPTAGLVHGVKVWLPAMTVTNLIAYVVTAGSVLTAGQCFAALYNDAATPALLSATADQAATWNSVGIKTMALSAPQAISAGFYHIAFFFNGTTGPAIFRGSNVTQLGLNMNLATPHLRAYTADASRTTTFPATMGAQTGIAQNLWAAVS